MALIHAEPPPPLPDLGLIEADWAAWIHWLAAQQPAQSGARLGRVAEDRRSQYVVRGLDADDEDVLVECAPEILRDARKGIALRPVVGDWVGVVRGSGQALPAIVSILPRRSGFVRRRAGQALREQTIAANVDVVLIMTAVDGDFNPRRLERYLSMAYEAQVTPVIVLSKIDRIDRPQDMLVQCRQVAGEALVIAYHRADETSLAEIRAQVTMGRTIACLGSSGVGKSTLINLLLGRDQQAVAQVRKDGKGRHTTTTRHLLKVPGGGVIIDTPGMRELGLWDAEVGVREAFIEVAQFAQKCRFLDCKHQREPDCAVQAAVVAGELNPQRVASYLKLERELADHDELTRGGRRERNLRGGKRR